MEKTSPQPHTRWLRVTLFVLGFYAAKSNYVQTYQVGIPQSTIMSLLYIKGSDLSSVKLPTVTKHYLKGQGQCVLHFQDNIHDSSKYEERIARHKLASIVFT